MKARSLVVSAIALLLVLFSARTASASFSDEAPADEYFGPFKVSVLEIRNRLTRFEGEQNGELATAGSIHGIDAVETAIEDWHRRYPRDSWLPGFLGRIVRVYVRAQAGGNMHARHAYVMLVSEYHATPQARDARRVARRMFL